MSLFERPGIAAVIQQSSMALFDWLFQLSNQLCRKKAQLFSGPFPYVPTDTHAFRRLSIPIPMLDFAAL